MYCTESTTVSTSLKTFKAENKIEYKATLGGVLSSFRQQ